MIPALCAPAGAGAEDTLVPAAIQGAPRVLAAGDSGAAIVAWATTEAYEGYGPMTVDTIDAGPTGTRRRWSVPRALLADSARDAGGNLDLLIGRRPAGRSGLDGSARLALYRARQNGRVRSVWSGPLGRLAAVARRGSTVAIVWIERPDARKPPTLRIATSTRGRPFSAARTVHRVLPGFLRTTDLSYVNDLGLTLDADARPVIALTASRRRGPVLVLATLNRVGVVRARQIVSGIDGLVQTHTTSRGRVAVLIDDTGVEGERGECVGDRDGRRLWATVHERRAARFEPVQRLDAHPLDCAGRGAHLAAGTGERIAVVWTAPAPGITRTVKASSAAPRQGFGTPVTVTPNASAQSAVLGVAGGVLDITSRLTNDAVDPYTGPLVHQWVNAGGIQSPEPVDLAGAAGALSDRNPGDTSTLIAWQRSGERTLRLRYYGGQ